MLFIYYREIAEQLSQICNPIEQHTGIWHYLKPLHGLGVWTGLDFARKQQLSGGCCHLFG